jgi:hypothetical protein
VSVSESEKVLVNEIRTMSTGASRSVVHAMLAVGLLVIGFGVGAGTMAIADSDSPQIVACVRRVTGEVRIVPEDRACTKIEQRVAWNQQGPPGPAGEKGDTGAQGPPGAGVGAFFVDGTNAMLDGGSGGGWRELATLTLAPGNYMVSAQASIRNFALSSRGIQCVVAHADGSWVARVIANVDGEQRDSQIQTTAPLTLAAEESLTWKCSAASDTTNVASIDSFLSATEVASIN